MFRMFNTITIVIRGSRIRFAFASRGFDHWFRMMNVKGIGIEDGNDPGASAILAKAKLLLTHRNLDPNVGMPEERPRGKAREMGKKGDDRRKLVTDLRMGNLLSEQSIGRYPGNRSERLTELLCQYCSQYVIVEE